MPDCLSASDSGVYNCTNLWGLNCTNNLGFEFTSLWNITWRIQQYCAIDPRLFLIDNIPATPDNAALTHAACKTFAPKAWTRYATSDIWSRLQTWKFPLFQLIASSPRPPLGLPVEIFVLMHLMSDPIGTIKDLLRKLSCCEERAKRYSELHGCSNSSGAERVWKSLAIIALSYDEWGEENGTLTEGLLRDKFIELQDQRQKLARFLEICYNASDALAADRATAFLPIMTAQGFFIGALAVAVSKAVTITSTSSLFVNIEAHSIAFSALYFWIIPAVFLSSTIGVSQTKGAIPRILNDLRVAFENDTILNFQLPLLDDIKARTVSGGIYSWSPRPKARDRCEALPDSVWLFVKDMESWLPIFTVASGTITAMLISGYVPADGWQPRHCAYATYLAIWIVSFLLTNWLKQPRASVLWTCSFLSTRWLPRRKSSNKPRHSDIELPNVQSPAERYTEETYIMFWATFLKDTIVALGTLGALMYIQVGPFNDCSSYTLWGRRGLALPGMPEVANALNSRIRSWYPVIAFTSISIQIFLIPIVAIIWKRKALRVLWQTDDGTSQWPSWLKQWPGWLKKRNAVVYSQDSSIELVGLTSISGGLGE